jgi:hypothetical protein
MANKGNNIPCEKPEMATSEINIRNLVLAFAITISSLSKH